MNKISNKSNMWISILMVCLFQLPFFAATAFGQFSVTGRVVEETGEPFPGVYVLVRGTSIGTATDVNGSYTINVPDESSVLQFTFLGYNTQEIQVGSQRVINVTLMEDAQQFEELVVTALGISRERRALAYAVSDVRADDITGAHNVSPIMALQGQAAGVAITGSSGGMFGVSRMQIRGVSTIGGGGNTQPIFVVDGVILANQVRSGAGEWSQSTGDWGSDLNNLDPETFESITILKGAAATALYGSRGLHGAVVITTKSGRTAQGLGITVSQTFGFDHVRSGVDFQYKYGPGNAAGGNSRHPGQNRFRHDNFGYAYYGEDNMIESLRMMPASQYSGSWGPEFDGRPIESYGRRIIPYSPNRRHFVDAFDLGWNSTTNVTVQGGDQSSNFLVSGSHSTRKGWSPGSVFDRSSFLIRGNQAVSQFLRAEASVNFSQSVSSNPPANLQDNFMRNMWKNVFDTKYYRDQWETPHGGQPNTGSGDTNVDIPGINNWWTINVRDEQRKLTTIMPVARLIATVSDFSFSLEGNMRLHHVRYENKQRGTGPGMSGTANGTGGRYQIEQELYREGTIRATTAYMTKINDFDFGMTVGGEWWINNGSTSNTMATEGGLVAPNQFFMGNSRNTRSGSASATGSRRTSSVFFLGTLSWKSQVYVDFTGRNDWSSTLVYRDGSGNNSYFYPSIGGSWIFSETFDLPNYVTMGKVRLSWAQVGNDMGAYSINQAYGSGTTEWVDGSLIQRHTYPSSLVDPSLKPERKNSVELGTDLHFFNNRLNFEFTYYKENTKDQIIQLGMPIESGISNNRINAGNIQNQGVEIVLRGQPVRTRDFRWDVNLMWARNTNKIIELHPTMGQFFHLAGDAMGGDFDTQSVAEIGGQYGTLQSGAKPKMHNGMKVLYWDQGQLSGRYMKSDEVQNVGKIEPDFTGSFRNNFTWKGVFVSVLLDFRWGGNFASWSNRYGTTWGILESTLKYRDSASGGLTWTSKYEERGFDTFHDGVIPDGIFNPDAAVWVTMANGQTRNVSGMTYREAYDAGIIEPTHASNYWTNQTNWNVGILTNHWFHEVKYIGLRNISIGYTIPNRFVERVGIRNLRLSLEGNNLGYLYSSLPNNLNPQSTSGNRNDNSYFERVLSPHVGTYNFTLRFNL